MRTLFLPALIIAMGSAAPACSTFPHRTLPAPPSASAPLAEREQYYDEYAPLAVLDAAVYGSMQSRGQPLMYVVLADGTRVDHAEDLAAVVEPTSPTARALAEAERRSSLSEMYSWAAGGVMGLGVAIQLGTLAVSVATIEPGNADDADIALILGGVCGGALVELAALWPGLLAVDEAARAQRERETAFVTYDNSLRDRLGLERRRTVATTSTALPRAALPPALPPDPAGGS